MLDFENKKEKGGNSIPLVGCKFIQKNSEKKSKSSIEQERKQVTATADLTRSDLSGHLSGSWPSS